MSSDVVKLVAPVVNGSRLVQSSAGVWYMDHPNLAKPAKIDSEGMSPAELINGVLDLDGYPTAKDCNGGNPETRTESGIIISDPDIDVVGNPLTLKLKHA